MTTKAQPQWLTPSEAEAELNAHPELRALYPRLRLISRREAGTPMSEADQVFLKEARATLESHRIQLPDIV